jgi:hypothetical protein
VPGSILQAEHAFEISSVDSSNSLAPSESFIYMALLSRCTKITANLLEGTAARNCSEAATLKELAIDFEVDYPRQDFLTLQAFSI